MKLREGTTDQCVYDEVITRNCYRVPESLVGQVVIDVGAHIGCFSKLCLDRGAMLVLAYELELENVEILKENLVHYMGMGFDIYHAAVWKPTEAAKVAPSGTYMTADGLLRNTGSSHIYIAPGCHTAVANGVEVVTMDQILEPFDRVGLVKLDCEGAEFEIVPTTKSWSKVDRLVGEVHGYRKEYHVPDFYMEVKKHFPNLEVVSSCPEYGLDNFFAWR